MTDFAKNLFDFIKSATLVTALGAPSVAAGVFAYERPDAILLLLSKVQSVEIGDFKVALGQKAFEINADLGETKTHEVRADLIKRARGLGPREVERLIHLLPLDETNMAKLGPEAIKCDYDKADARTRLYAVIDKSLEEKKLIEIERRDEFIDQKVHPQFGRPSACYQTVVTAAGADVKSMIVAELTRYFAGELDVGAPPIADKPASQRSKEKLSKTRRDQPQRIAAR
ncbi:hypothetical protein IY145_22200 [Methylosinus sp. H3A]|uniref:hypothetical protein n=1 Tax=Methylosinus sp. H3A TaxID=2785786 RepID=UPI0018C2F818|nr:hypothetical protein [Methylosinus sp. H3A]MBG0812057.1 hypothetical protein [Methylosinus sp. H3A]